MRIEKRVRGRWFWRRYRYYVVSELLPVELGPFYTFCEASQHYRIVGLARLEQVAMGFEPQ
jgi:hypothetical protein